MKLNLQMYSFMDGEHNDSKENLKLASQMGFQGVELFGPDFMIPAEEMKQLLEEYGLQAVSLHAPMTAMVEQLIPYAQTVGMSYIGIGMETLKNESDVHAFAKELNRIGGICRENGLRLTYHNHTQEFAKYKDQTIMEILMAETEPDLVSFELDAGWAAAAGVDPVQFVKDHTQRVRLLHIKESSKVIGPQPPMDFSGFEKDADGRPVLPEEIKKTLDENRMINCPAGDGLVDWKIMTQTAAENGCDYFIVEREYAPSGKRIEWLTNDINFYHELLKGSAE
ncbi:MAG: sugar phosphate isomerase/epimerase family protein [Lachnospiraceae bacterium]